MKSSKKKSNPNRKRGSINPHFAVRALDRLEGGDLSILLVDETDAPKATWDFDLEKYFQAILNYLKSIDAENEYKLFVVGVRDPEFKVKYADIDLTDFLQTGVDPNKTTRVPYFVVDAVLKTLPDPTSVFVVEGEGAKAVTYTKAIQKVCTCLLLYMLLYFAVYDVVA